MRLLIYRRGPLLNSIGGMEKMIVLLANAMAARGNSVELLANSDSGGELRYSLDEAVTLENLRCDKLPKFRRTLSGLARILPGGDMLLRQVDAINPWLYRHQALRKHIAASKPDVIVATSPVEMADLCFRGKPDAPIVMCFHMYPQVYFDHNEAIKAGTPSPRERQNWSINREFAGNAACAQVFFESFKDVLAPYYQGRIESIPNVIEPQPASSHAQHVGKDKYTIAYVARLEDGKQQHRLIEAFAKVAAKHPEWTLHLWGGAGKASYEDMLMQQIAGFGLQERVLLKGHCDDPIRVYGEADICAYPSRHEGFGLSLAEALSVGLPAVGFKTAAGVNQLILDGQNGILAEDCDDAFAEALLKLMGDLELRRSLGARAAESVRRFEPETVWNAWHKLLSSLA